MSRCISEIENRGFSHVILVFSGVIFRKNPDPSGWSRIDGLNPIQMEKDFRGSPFCRTYLDPLGLAATTSTNRPDLSGILLRGNSLHSCVKLYISPLVTLPAVGS